MSRIPAEAGPEPVLPLTSTTTLDEVIAFRTEHQEWSRKVRFYGAATTLGQLMALGVVCTEDDAFDSAMRAEDFNRRAVERFGPTPTREERLALQAEDARNAAVAAAVDWLVRVVWAGETPAERAARRSAAIPVGRHPSGRPCRHADKHVSAYEDDLRTPHGAVDVRVLRWSCAACGAAATVEDVAAPTQEAIEALRIVGLGAVADRLWQSHRWSVVVQPEAMPADLRAAVIAAGEAVTDGPGPRVGVQLRAMAAALEAAAPPVVRTFNRATEALPTWARWVTLTRRTEDPKLGYLERALWAAGVPCFRQGWSAHAPILKIRCDDTTRAWEILTPIDDLDDDDPRFVAAEAVLA